MEEKKLEHNYYKETHLIPDKKPKKKKQYIEDNKLFVINNNQKINKNNNKKNLKTTHGKHTSEYNNTDTSYKIKKNGSTGRKNKIKTGESKSKLHRSVPKQIKEVKFYNEERQEQRKRHLLKTYGRSNNRLK